MKAVIVEIRGKYAAILSEDGIIRRMKNRQYTVGQEITVKSRTYRNIVLVRRIASAAAAVIILGTTAWAYYSPYSYVSLDAIPSIEYSVNRFGRVLSYSAVDEDGADILDSLRLNNKNIKDAVSETIHEIAQAGYFDDRESNILIAASGNSEQKSDKLACELKETAVEEANKDNLNVSFEAVGVGPEHVQRAKELGVTPGKLILVNRLQDSGQILSEEEIMNLLDSPVKDLMKQIQENKDEEKAVSQNSQGKDNQDTAEGEPNDINGNQGKDKNSNNSGNENKNPNANSSGNENKNPNANSSGSDNKNPNANRSGNENNNPNTNSNGNENKNPNANSGGNENKNPNANSNGNDNKNPNANSSGNENKNPNANSSGNQ